MVAILIPAESLSGGPAREPRTGVNQDVAQPPTRIRLGFMKPESGQWPHSALTRQTRLPGLGSHTAGWSAMPAAAGAGDGARGRGARTGAGPAGPGGGARGRPAPRASPPRRGPEGAVALPSPPGRHGGRSCGPRTRREPSSGEEAAPVTAMAAESALQVVEKLQARLAANPDPKKVSERAARRAGVGRTRPRNGRGPSAAPRSAGAAGLGPGARPRSARSRSREVPALAAAHAENPHVRRRGRRPGLLPPGRGGGGGGRTPRVRGSRAARVPGQLFPPERRRVHSRPVPRAGPRL